VGVVSRGAASRVLEHQAFNDDRRDAGELGAGHSVTALYEIITKGMPVPESTIDRLKYQALRVLTAAADSDELMTVKLRYKAPEDSRSRLLEVPIRDTGASFARASGDFRFAASVAGFGMLLLGSEYKGTWAFSDVRRVASGCTEGDQSRSEFVELVDAARSGAGT
jgi:Ca-activated chloride channel family protein